jgi:hypothetical protein
MSRGCKPRISPHLRPVGDEKRDGSVPSILCLDRGVAVDGCDHVDTSLRNGVEIDAGAGVVGEPARPGQPVTRPGCECLVHRQADEDSPHVTGSPAPGVPGGRTRVGVRRPSPRKGPS